MTAFITFDLAAFKADVKKYIDLSPVVQWGEVKLLKWPSSFLPPQLWTTIPLLLSFIAAVCSAVELAKVNLIKAQDPDGSKGAKFDREVALAAAAEIITSGIKFNGFWGLALNRFWPPIVNVLVSLWVAQQPSNWAAVALSILKLAAVV